MYHFDESFYFIFIRRGFSCTTAFLEDLSFLDNVTVILEFRAPALINMNIVYWKKFYLQNVHIYAELVFIFDLRAYLNFEIFW